MGIQDTACPSPTYNPQEEGNMGSCHPLSQPGALGHSSLRKGKSACLLQMPPLARSQVPTHVLNNSPNLI